MKIFILFALFASGSAFAACPNLAGTYGNCTNVTNGGSTGNGTVVVTQSVANGILTYKNVSTSPNGSKEEETIAVNADGSSLSSPVSQDTPDGKLTGTQVVSCDATGSLLLDQVLTVSVTNPNGGTNVSVQALAHVSIVMDSNGAVLEDMTGSVNGQTIPETKLRCEKIAN